MQGICQGFEKRSTGRKCCPLDVQPFRQERSVLDRSDAGGFSYCCPFPPTLPTLIKPTVIIAALHFFLPDLGNITTTKSFAISFLDYLIFSSICFIILFFTFNHVENVVCHSALLFKTEAVFPQKGMLVAHSRIPPLEFPWPKEGTKSCMIPFVYNNTHFILFFKLKYSWFTM